MMAKWHDGAIPLFNFIGLIVVYIKIDHILICLCFCLSISWVNPSDCVDMDCDGPKKAMIRDLDGTFLGSAGTVIPEAEFEWDGDPRRGLGDYRIPPVMVTNLDGSRIPYEDKMPNKGQLLRSKKEKKLYCWPNPPTLNPEFVLFYFKG